MDMKIGIVGAGRVGCAFAAALADRGVEISGVYSRTPEWTDYIGKRLNRTFPNDLEQVVEDAALVLLTVSDSSISKVSDRIALECCNIIKGKVFLHCSGALTSAELGALASKGAYTGSLHPIQTFADRENGWKGLTRIYSGFEGSTDARILAKDLIDVLDGTLLDIKPEAKPLYHAAACFISNYVVALSQASSILLALAGVGNELGIKPMMPLLKNSVHNIEAVGIEGALTGPIARGDMETVKAHLKAMDAIGHGVMELYKAAGVLAVDVALRKGTIHLEQANELLKILGKKV